MLSVLYIAVLGKVGGGKGGDKRESWDTCREAEREDGETTSARSFVSYTHPAPQLWILVK